jgi:hypothetical protein
VKAIAIIAVGAASLGLVVACGGDGGGDNKAKSIATTAATTSPPPPTTEPPPPILPPTTEPPPPIRQPDSITFDGKPVWQCYGDPNVSPAPPGYHYQQRGPDCWDLIGGSGR